MQSDVAGHVDEASAGARRTGQVWSAAVAVIGLAALLVTRADPDLWGHLRFGLDMLDDGRLPSADPYSFTQDRPWINHEWLSELQMAVAYQAGGVVGLLVLKAVLLALPLALVWRAYGRARIGVRAAVVAVIVFGTIHVTATARPQVWTFACLGVLVSRLNGGPPRVGLLVPLFALWANCHGGWIVGLGVLVVWAASASWVRPDLAARWFGLVAASALATLINPYGLDLWHFIAATVRPTRDITEWLPLWNTPVLNWVPWILCVGVTLWMGRTRERLPAVAVLALLAFGSLRVMRIESLFVLTAALLAAPALALRWPAERVVPTAVGQRAKWVAWTALVVAIAASGMLARWATTCVPVVGDWVPDEAVVAALEESQVEGRLVNPFDWGEYAIWHLGPRLQVSIDGRRETVFSDELLARHRAVMAGETAGLAAIRSWNPDFVWLRAADTVLLARLEAMGYRRDLSTGISSLATRSDRPVVRLSDDLAVDAGRRCFPD